MGVVLPKTGLRARLPSSLGLLPWALDTRATLCVPRLHEPWHEPNHSATSGARHPRNAGKRRGKLASYRGRKVDGGTSGGPESEDGEVG